MIGCDASLRRVVCGPVRVTCASRVARVCCRVARVCCRVARVCYVRPLRPLTSLRCLAPVPHLCSRQRRPAWVDSAGDAGLCEEGLDAPSTEPEREQLRAIVAIEPQTNLVCGLPAAVGAVHRLVVTADSNIYTRDSLPCNYLVMAITVHRSARDTRHDPLSAPHLR